MMHATTTAVPPICSYCGWQIHDSVIIWLFGTMPHHADCANKALATTAPEGWRLVPVELMDFIAAKEHHLPVEDRHALSAMLATTAPEGVRYE